MNYGANAFGLLVVRDQRIGIGKSLGSLNWTWSFSWGYEINNCFMQDHAISVIFCDVFCGVDLHCSSSVERDHGLFSLSCVSAVFTWLIRSHSVGTGQCWRLKEEWSVRLYKSDQVHIRVCACTHNIYTYALALWSQKPFSPGTGLESHDHAIGTTTSGTSFAASVEQSLLPTKSVVAQRPARSSVPWDSVLMGKATGNVLCQRRMHRRESDLSWNI